VCGASVLASTCSVEQLQLQEQSGGNSDSITPRRQQWLRVLYSKFTSTISHVNTAEIKIARRCIFLDSHESEKTMKTALAITSAICLLFAVIGLSPGEAQTVSSSIGILPAGKSVTLTFDIRVRTPMPDSVTQVGTQGSISGSNFATLLTDDPDTGAPNDSTKTPVVSPPLPIQLASFTGHEVTGGGVLLQWTTLSEINNYGFYVHRRDDSQPAFSELPNSFIAGHGTTNEPQHYEYRDMSATAALWHYRLKQVDLDGTIHLTDPIQVRVLTAVKTEAAPREFSLSQNFPNPFNPATEIKFSVETTDRARLEVYNVLGQLIVRLFDDVAEAGKYYKVRFDAERIVSGVYFYRLHSGKKSDLKKLLLLK
jgi:hypothetical protein